MGRARHAKQERRRAPPTLGPAAWRQGLIAVGVVQHPITGNYQVWLHARGQTAILLAFRTLEQADAAKQALGEALLRGDHATPERWVAAVAAIGAETDVAVEPVADDVFAAINAQIQGAAVVPSEAPMQPAGAGADNPTEFPERDDSHARVPIEQR
jgi:hypothetical protein